MPSPLKHYHIQLVANAMTTIKNTAIIATLLLVAACGTPLKKAHRASINGEYYESVQLHKKAYPNTEDADFTPEICDAYYKIKDYKTYSLCSEKELWLLCQTNFSTYYKRCREINAIKYDAPLRKYYRKIDALWDRDNLDRLYKPTYENHASYNKVGENQLKRMLPIFIDDMSIALEFNELDGAEGIADAIWKTVKINKSIDDAGNTDTDEIDRIRAYGILSIYYIRTNREYIARDILASLAGREGIYTSLASSALRHELYYWIACIYFSLEEYANSRIYLEKYTGLTPEKIIFAGLFGLALAPLGMSGQAAEIVTGDFNAQNDQLILEQFMLAKCLLEMHEPKAAKELLDAVLKDKATKGLGLVLVAANIDRARIALDEGDISGAFAHSSAACDALEGQRNTIGKEMSKIYFIQDKEAAYGIAVECLVKSGEPQKALEYVERGKSRALVDLLRSDKNANAAPHQELAGLMAQLDSLEADFKASELNNDPDFQNGKRRSITVIQTKLHASNPMISELIGGKTCSADAIRSKLPQGTNLLEFYIFRDSLYIFTVSSSRVSVVVRSAEGLDEHVKKLRDAILTQSADYEMHSKMLYDRLFSNIELRRNTIIVPHGILHHIPFAALSDGHQFLCERTTLRQLPSSSITRYLKQQGKEDNLTTAVVFGNPNLGNKQLDLPGTEREARAISRLVPRSQLLLRDQASESTLKELIGEADIVHLAAHGTYDAKTPFASSVLLSPGKKEDGHLTAGEIYAMRTKARLVVLSACETGIGTIMAGDDVIGLNRAFLYAGAGSLVSSLWKISDDATEKLMVDFYANLRREPTPLALQEAQVNALKRYPHPYFWAGFYYTGL